MANEEIKNEEVVENPQANVEEQETDSLVSLIKQAAELSRMSAIVNLAYARARSAEKAKEGYDRVTSEMDSRIKATVGSIKENSKLYDETKAKKEEIASHYKEVVDVLATHYDSRIEDSLAEKAQLESENLSLTADNQNLKLDQKDAKSQYKKSEKSQKDSDIVRAIAAKKAEAEKLAEEGDLDGAQAAIEEYKKLKDSQVQETAGGMIEIATVSKQIKENRQQFKANKARIKEIEAEIKRLEIEKDEKIDKAYDLEEKELTEVNEKTSVFKKIAMLASKAMTKAFNKGKAVNDQVFEPMKKKIAEKISVAQETIGITVEEIKESTKESFKDKLNRAMEFGRDIRQNAIDKLKARNDKARETQQSRKEYLDSRKEEEEKE